MALCWIAAGLTANKEVIQIKWRVEQCTGLLTCTFDETLFAHRAPHWPASLEYRNRNAGECNHSRACLQNGSESSGSDSHIIRCRLVCMWGHGASTHLLDRKGLQRVALLRQLLRGKARCSRDVLVIAGDLLEAP